jgi:hypothetical protein
MWPFKKKDDIVSKRLLGHSCDISFIYSRLSQHERFMQYELLDLVHKLDKRMSDLEKLLKSSNITFTIVEKK